MTSPPDNQLTALREEIRRGGKAIRSARLVGLGALCAVTIPGVLLGFFVFGVRTSNSPFNDPAPTLPFTLETFLRLAGPLIGCSGFVGWSLATVIYLTYRTVCLRQLRKGLDPLSPAQRRQVLLSFCDEGVGETRWVVRSLAGQYQLSAELTPAAAPPGRGDEASPAGDGS